jgi:hypothetical protein
LQQRETPLVEALGEIRSVTISKPDTMFPPPQQLKPSLDAG